MHSFKILALATLFAGVAAAQTAAPKPVTPGEKPKAPAAAPAPVNGAEPVITIENLCPSSKPGADCKTVITKAEFERVLNAIRPNLPASARMQLAQKYVELLTFAEKAEQAGLDKSPEFQQQLQLMRMQALAGAYSRHLQQNSAKASDPEVEKYYLENKPAYEEVTLKRIYIPKPPTGGEKKPPLDEAATKALAEKIQARAAAGEDFDKLQAEAFAVTNPDAPKNSVPQTTLGVRRRGQLPPSQESVVFELAAGKASPVLEEPAAYFIYKVESKQVLPLEQVKGQIARQLDDQKLRDAVQQTLGSVKTTYNENYFKPAAEPEPKPATLPSNPPK